MLKSPKVGASPLLITVATMSPSTLFGWSLSAIRYLGDYWNGCSV